MAVLRKPPPANLNERVYKNRLEDHKGLELTATGDLRSAIQERYTWSKCNLIQSFFTTLPFTDIKYKRNVVVDDILYRLDATSPLNQHTY